MKISKLLSTMGMLAISANTFMVQGVGAQSRQTMPPLDFTPTLIANPLPCRACLEPTLMGTNANIHYGNLLPNTDWNGVVSNVVEVPYTMGLPLSWNDPRRFNVDLQSNIIRISVFRGPMSGQPPEFKFTLNPTALSSCGPVRIVGSKITTNRPDIAPSIISQSSFSSTANTVTISLGNQVREGDVIEAQLSFDCQPVPPVSTCCPPVTKQMVKGMFKHEGNAASNYTMSLDLNSSATSSFLTGLQAYLAYLKTQCPQTVDFKVDFFTGPVAPPATSGGPAGPLLGAAASTPKSSVLVSGLTTTSLNSGLSGMNGFSYVNGQYYRTSVKIVGVNAAGQPVNCGFNAQECQVDDTFGFIFSTTDRRTGGPYTD